MSENRRGRLVGPVEPRHASSVILLRDTLSGPEVYVQERASTMSFCASMTVFPGGGVDARDMPGDVDQDGHESPGLQWQGQNLEWWGERLSKDTAMARALVCAAVRETFEESGTLLAGTADGTVVGDTAPFQAERKLLENHQLSFSDFMDNNKLVLRADLLRPWANWVTPKEQPIRYDTAFFVAQLPEGQIPRGDTREATSTGWFRPATLLDGWRSKKISLMPPTWAQLKLLDTFRTVAEVMEFSANLSVDPVTVEPVDEPYMAEYYLMETKMFGTPRRHFAPGMKFAVAPEDLPAHPFESNPGSYLQ
ncbi:NUDIX hydrolase [Corynebacterium suicordis]|uniref:NUDIX hydrolase n=1 Tax=Corynebacterium suicordis DSM 45110 TaxID=1121369 RepID=A0ABR9ZL01_9CORY|nr:NUDIX hydrolase [Corynebacterium suicordis]MBF4553302.1 NUDIX hydrolase [Corynebacterium suicordis DSM 45110]MDR6277728.1 8-oxo-dGTP pyrophosphatase MutT (NUDIX family) [Corynebacterium suicordis]